MVDKTDTPEAAEEQTLEVEVEQRLKDLGLGDEWHEVFEKLYELVDGLDAVIYEAMYSTEQGTPLILDMRVILDPEGHYETLLTKEPPTNAIN